MLKNLVKLKHVTSGFYRFFFIWWNQLADPDLELKGGRGRGLFWFTLPAAFSPFGHFFFFFTQNKRGVRIRHWKLKPRKAKLKVNFNFGIWLHYMKTKNYNSDNNSFFRQQWVLSGQPFNLVLTFHFFEVFGMERFYSLQLLISWGLTRTVTGTLCFFSLGFIPNRLFISKLLSFSGWQIYIVLFLSSELKCDMNFAVYVPPQAEKEKVPVLYWLSGNSTYGEVFFESSIRNFSIYYITFDFNWFQA